MYQNKVQCARQGDVYIRPAVFALGLKFAKSKRVTLALGERTGHAHVLEADTEVEFATAPDGRLNLKIGEGGARVVHEEHGTVTLPAGEYAVSQQREYDPATEARAVID